MVCYIVGNATVNIVPSPVFYAILISLHALLQYNDSTPNRGEKGLKYFICCHAQFNF